MCDSTMIANGEFTPIIIRENKMQFIYRDKYGIEHVLIEEFAMDITISKASVKEVKQDGKAVKYIFEVE